MALKTKGLILTAADRSAAALPFVRQVVKKFLLPSLPIQISSHSSSCLCLLTPNLPLEISSYVDTNIPFSGLECFKARDMDLSQRLHMMEKTIANLDKVPPLSSHKSNHRNALPAQQVSAVVQGHCTVISWSTDLVKRAKVSAEMLSKEVQVQPTDMH